MYGSENILLILSQNVAGELKECLSDLTSEVNLSDLQITLDIICLMLPPETDVTETSSRPCYYRMTSHMSQVSYTSTSPPASDVLGETDDLASLPTTTDAGWVALMLQDQSMVAFVLLQLHWLKGCMF